MPKIILLAAFVLALSISRAGADTDLALASPPATLAVTKVVVLKGERRLHLLHNDWVLRTFDIALGRNPKGPKYRQGDGRTPEGEYVLDWRKADSQYYRAIHISYPNAFDEFRARTLGVPAGGMIMIHGQPNHRPVRYHAEQTDWTEGCIAVSNAAMDEIWAAVEDGTPIEIHP